jgi:hypothetical protein
MNILIFIIKLEGHAKNPTPTIQKLSSSGQRLLLKSGQHFTMAIKALAKPGK